MTAFAAVVLAVFGGASARAQQVVISQVYGGGGGTGATYNSDFVELHNRGASSVSLSTWSVQYASSTGSSWAARTLSGSIAAGGYYLIRMTTSGTIGLALPTPDITVTTNDMAAGTGKVALVSATTALPAQSCFEVGTNGIVDMVGYGQAALPSTAGPNCYEGSGGTQPVLTTALAAIRNNGGCDDTQDNALNFTNGAPAPRNSASAAFACTPTGACCNGTSCSYTTSAACTGTYQGDFTFCGAVSYPAPTSPGTPFEDISGTGTLITTLDNSDDGTAAFSFTPPFLFHGKPRNIVSMGVNGLVTFLPGTTAGAFTTPSSSPNIATPNDFIAPLWGDHFNRTTLTGGHLYVQALGSPNRLVMQWKNVSTRISSTVTPDTLNFEVILFLDGTGNFDMRYGAMNTTATTPPFATLGFNNLSPTVQGVENQAGTAGTYFNAGSFAALANTDRHWTPGGSSACAPPANDTCATATTIGSGGTAGISGNSVLATLDGPVLGCGVNVDSDVWYSFQPGSSCYTWDISTCTGTAFDTVVEVYDACGGTLIACNDDDGSCGSGVQSRITGLALSTSTTYKIRVAKSGFPSAGGTFTLAVTPTPPGNDVCGVNQASYTIPCNGGTVCGNLAVANSEGNAAASCMSGTGQRDLFYYFTPCNPCATGWTFSTCGPTNVDTTVSILSACPTVGANNQYSAADCFDEGCSSGGANLTLGTATDLIDGNSYIIRVGMWSSTSTPGAFDLTVTPVISNANDVCAGAIALTSGVPANGSTTCATFDTLSSCDAVGRDVWYKYTAPAYNGTYTLTTCGSAIDTAISVFSSCGGAEIACDDNSAACGGGADQVVLALTAGQSIFIRVSDHGFGAGGSFTLTNDFFVPPPTNDECVAATAISGSGAFAYDNTFATPTTVTAPSSACQALQSKDIWYSWTSEGPGSVTVDTCGGPTWDSVITIYTGACGTLTEFACDDDTCVTPNLGSSVAFTAAACTTYTIRISSYNATIGVAGSFNITAPGPIDSDGDTVTDCLDGCPLDGAKIVPGICGCGIADVDTDGDTVADCLDGCPLDSAKTTPGQCGCGFADTDTDGDLVADCVDGCPLDSAKTTPGQCGCGFPDTDTDGDLVADCVDGCPLDGNKTSPGVCGCGIADTDSDGDLAADCIDGCPFDGNKIAPGICGCGSPDIDSDGDSVLDCNDGCPFDGNKTTPGVCGCGVSDVDTDGDSVADCLDGCPLDGNKTAPGQCGCGIADTDTDFDGVADCNDNCDSIANPGQEDCDGDTVGDVCEYAANTATDLNNNNIPDNCEPGSINTYCTSGTSVTGCSPSIGTFGTPSASQPNGFYIATFGNDGQRFGQFFYALGTMSAPFNAGYMCVSAPRQRMGAPFTTGGTIGLCNGALFLDVNVFSAANPGALGQPLATGITYYFEGYNRDPLSPGGLVMSNAVGVTFLP